VNIFFIDVSPVKILNYNSNLDAASGLDSLPIILQTTSNPYRSILL